MIKGMMFSVPPANFPTFRWWGIAFTTVSAGNIYSNEVKIRLYDTVYPVSAYSQSGRFSSFVENPERQSDGSTATNARAVIINDEPPGQCTFIYDMGVPVKVSHIDWWYSGNTVISCWIRAGTDTFLSGYSKVQSAPAAGKWNTFPTT